MEQRDILPPRITRSVALTTRSRDIGPKIVLNLSPLRRVCLAASHPTTELPFIYYSANVSTVKVSGASYAKIAEQAEDTDDQRRKEREEENRVEHERREER